jgi:hypothetical protein
MTKRLAICKVVSIHGKMRLNQLDFVKSISVDEFAQIKDADNTIEVLDVRKKSEYFSEQMSNT